VPNDTNDGDLQLRLSLPPLAKANPWTNLVDPPVRHAPRMTDESVLSYVREDNYLQGGTILPARALGAPPPAWDVNGNGRWDGYAPDAFFSFDASGFDHRPDGSPTGWRAFAYYPLPGAFLPANGSFDDVLIRLPDAFRTDATGKPDSAVYRANLAIVEALIRRVDVPIDAVDETALGADLDLDGEPGALRRNA
jgi:hypothetical protein